MVIHLFFFHLALYKIDLESLLEADIILKTDEVKGISFYHNETNEIMKTIYADENNVITLRYKDFDGLTSKLNAKFIEKWHH